MTPTSGGPLPAVAPAHPDWLFHHLPVEGSAEAVAAFRAAASGAGIIPWHLDLDRVEEDAFLRLAAPTTEALRHVALAPDRQEGAPAGAVFRFSFWTADWTPWRALATVRARFPALRFDVQPHYERA